MTLQEFKDTIKNKTFKSTVGGLAYQFIPEITLRVKNDMRRSVHYEITEQDGKFILNHNYLLSTTEPVILDIISNANNRLELTLYTLISNKFMGTWIEEQDPFHL